MSGTNSYQDLFEKAACCVAIPTYNNLKTLPDVLDSVQQYTVNIIVINDGSTDGTEEFLKTYENLTVINFPSKLKNPGWFL